ncbi:MAG: Holliday junction resolvase RuvX [Gammaproteobacteria bacterium]|nr:Holliday junction resolvase RuvX [Gammaproteobacteria bacterium]
MAIESFPENRSLPLTALAFDFGTNRIGVAFGQSLSGTACAVCVLKAKDGVPDWEQIEKLIQEWNPDAFLIGLPYNMDGSESEMLVRARKFGNRLQGRFHKHCFGIDERLSSVQARDQLAITDGDTKKGAAIDDVAAQIILENWFAELRKS